MDYNDPIVAKKLQKAGREKLRRDRLNEQFIELGKSFDADRPKNDKANILADTIQLLKELTAEVEKLKSEHAVLSEESSELIQVKNDLKEEKETLQSDIERLNAQYRQRLGPAYPWPSMDHAVFPHPPSYSYPMPYSYPTLQPYPFFGSPIPGMFPNPCSTFIPYVNCNTRAEQQSTQLPPSSCHPVSGALISGEGLRTCDKDRENQIDKHGDSNGVGTNLELKTPGSSVDEEASSLENKSKKPPLKKNTRVGGSSSRCSSSHSVQDSSSNSVVGGGNTDD